MLNVQDDGLDWLSIGRHYMPPLAEFSEPPSKPECGDGRCGTGAGGLPRTSAGDSWCLPLGYIREYEP